MNGMRSWHLPQTWILLHIFFSAAQSKDNSHLGTCGEFQFQCESGQCVRNSVQCDGARDCDDGSDETFWLCRKLDLKCSPSSFRCVYGACVDGDALCNGRKDCDDNSDELHPSCFKANIDPVQKNLRCDALYNFTCLSGECVDSVAVCDGQLDCKDGSDETLTQCFNMTCQPNSFQCAYGGCIDGEKVCDGNNDCFDGTDEVRAFCPPEGYSPPQRGPSVDESGEGCLLPEYPRYGSYVLGGCKPGEESDYCQSEPGTKVQSYTQLTYDCRRGYVLPVNPDGETVSDTYCYINEWNNNITCQKMCEPVFSETLDLKCDFYGKKVPCDQYARPGTKMIPRCKPFYHPHEPVTVYRHTRCTNVGEWEDPLFKCIPDSAEDSSSKKHKPTHSNDNPAPCKECNTTAPRMSDRVLLCLALINAGVPITRFGSQIQLKTSSSNRPTTSGQKDRTAQMAEVFNLLDDLQLLNEYSTTAAYNLNYRRKPYLCYDASVYNPLLSDTQKMLLGLENTIRFIASPPEQPSKVDNTNQNNVLANQLQRKMGNDLQDAIDQCKKFAVNGMDDLLKTLQ